MITKKDIIKTTVDKHGEFTQKEIGEIFDTIIDDIKHKVASGERVSIPKFGIFESKERAARTARNPVTGDPVEVPAYKVCKFKPATDFKNMVKG